MIDRTVNLRVLAGNNSIRCKRPAIALTREGCCFPEEWKTVNTRRDRFYDVLTGSPAHCRCAVLLHNSAHRIVQQIRKADLESAFKDASIGTHLISNGHFDLPSFPCPPSDDAEELENAYNSDQRTFAAKIYDKIRETWDDAPEERFLLGFVFIFCKEQEKEYQVPLFRLLWEKSDTGNVVRFVDTACRVYKSAQDWKDKNCLPMMKYCFPKRLYYTCNTGGAYKFDPERQTDVGFGTSPACDLLARTGRIADVVISTVAMTVGVVAIITPVGFVSAPILSGVAGTSTGYGVSRAAQRLIDKLDHGESITDLEGTLLILSIVAAPLNMLSGFVSAQLAAGAASGRIFSPSQRILATLLKWTAIGIESFSLILDASSLIEKQRNSSLTALGVLQFSVRALFFGNTLIQPITALGVIELAQQQRITTIADNMTDAQAKEAFKSYLEQNKGDGSIKDRSEIVRNLNHMEDPNYFFKSVNVMESVERAGRKGRRST